MTNDKLISHALRRLADVADDEVMLHLCQAFGPFSRSRGRAWHQQQAVSWHKTAVALRDHARTKEGKFRIEGGEHVG